MSIPYLKNNLTREGIITNMCYTWRHDYGMPNDPNFPGLGMTEDDKKFLWRQMAQIFDNDIYPNLEFKK